MTRQLGLISNVGAPVLYSGLAWLLQEKGIVLWNWVGVVLGEDTAFLCFLVLAGFGGLVLWAGATIIQGLKKNYQRWPSLAWLALGEGISFLAIVYVLLGGSALRALAFPILTLGFFFSFAPEALRAPSKPTRE